jgi:multimeric flavodoxin WrbA
MKVFMDRWNPLAGRGIFDGKKSLIVNVGQTNRNESESIGRALTSMKFFSDDAGFQFGGEFSFEECLKSNDIEDKKEQFTKFDRVLEQYITILQ